MISCVQTGKSLTLRWPGPYVLQGSQSPLGPYTDVPLAASPFQANAAAGAHRFYRLRSPPLMFSYKYTPGVFQMSGPGVMGYNFVFQASSNLSTWINLQTNLCPVTFSDTNAWRYPYRFYRVGVAH